MKISYFKYLYILLIVLVLSIIGSYAYYSWGSNSNINVSFDVISEKVYIEYDAGSDIEGFNMYPVDDKSDGISKTITVKTDKTISKTITFNLYLDLTSVDSALLDSSFKWAVYSNNSLVNSGNFSSGSVSCNKDSSINHVVLLSNQAVTTTEKQYILYLWIDGNNTNSDGMMGKSFSFNLHADGVNALLKEEGSSLEDTFNNASKSSVTSAGGEVISVASDINLMQDSFGNIRYYGSSPNNYVTFNGESGGWRIIGLFDTENESGSVSKRLKLVRDTSIGSFSYNNSSTSLSNDWSNSRLMKLLNYGYDGNLYWSRGSGSCYSGESDAVINCNFSTIGLLDSAKNLIDKVKYNLGGTSVYEGLYADDYYSYERGSSVYSNNNTYWYGYVGIIYPSDYMYASDLSVCNSSGYDFSLDEGNCLNTDWLYKSNTSYWTMMPRSDDNEAVFNVFSGGFIYDYNYVYESQDVFPVLYLKSSVKFIGGTGSQLDPYILG